jgi:DNA-binding NtrC family response regulator
VRIIAATNADLEDAIRAGKFRDDLYYRLNVVTVRMPSLKERTVDIPTLADQFAKAYCEREQIAYRGIGDAALKRLQEHDWPGNVRELKNAVESALVLSRDGAVRREFLPESIRGQSFGEIRDLLREERETEAAPTGEGEDSSITPLKSWLTASEVRSLERMEERSKILEALTRAGGDKSLAASILGWSRMTLYRKMKRLEIPYQARRQD